MWSFLCLAILFSKPSAVAPKEKVFKPQWKYLIGTVSLGIILAMIGYPVFMGMLLIMGLPMLLICLLIEKPKGE